MSWPNGCGWSTAQFANATTVLEGDGTLINVRRHRINVPMHRYIIRDIEQDIGTLIRGSQDHIGDIEN